MFPAQLPIPIMLQLGGAGYNHSQIGKRHLAPPLSNISCNPLDQGFNWTAGSTRNVTGVDGNYYSWMKQVNCEISRAEIYATTDATAQTFRPNGPGHYTYHYSSIRDDRWKLIQSQPRSNPAIKYELYDLENAPSGTDGGNLCHCPGTLSDDALAAYERLSQALVELSGP